MNTTEKVLIEKAQNDDIEAFEELIRGNQKKVFNIALGMMGNHDDAYDISQEVFIRVFRSLKKFRGQSAFSTWLYRITVNACLDELRRRKKDKGVVSLDQEIQFTDGEVIRQVEDDNPTPEIVAESKELQNMVKNAISKLSHEHRKVIVLRDIQGFSYEDIAKIIRRPQGTVKSRINRARRILKDTLKIDMELWDKNYVK